MSRCGLGVPLSARVPPRVDFPGSSKLRSGDNARRTSFLQKRTAKQIVGGSRSDTITKNIVNKRKKNIPQHSPMAINQKKKNITLVNNNNNPPFRLYPPWEPTCMFTTGTRGRGKGRPAPHPRPALAYGTGTRDQGESKQTCSAPSSLAGRIRYGNNKRKGKRGVGELKQTLL